MTKYKINSVAIWGSDITIEDMLFSSVQEAEDYIFSIDNCDRAKKVNSKGDFYYEIHHPSIFPWERSLYTSYSWAEIVPVNS
jgi:hypothetical protein